MAGNYHGKPSVGAQTEGAASVNSEARESVPDLIRALRSYAATLRREDDISRFGHPADIMDEAAVRIERLELALGPFIALRDQAPSQMVKIIHKGVDGLTPIALTVTKDQFKAACAALSSQNGGAAT